MGKKLDATDDGVSEEQAKAEEETAAEAGPSLLTDRNSIMESIIESNDEAAEQYNKDMGVADDAGDTGAGDTTPDHDDGNTNDGEGEPPEEKPEMVKITVDGEEKEVLLSDVLDAGTRTYQKESAADKRLEEATRLLKEAKEQKPTDDDIPGDDEDGFTGSMTPKQIAEALQYGTAEEAAVAVEQMNSQGRSREAVTPERVQEITRETVRSTNNAEKIAHKFDSPADKGGFKDLADDPHLRRMVIDGVNEQLKAGKPNTWETYEAAGTKVRGWLEERTGGTPKDSFTDKKERKKTIDNVQAAGAAKGNVNQKPKGQTASEVIEEIGASRPGR